jgi:hypothetical protein
MLSFEYVPQVRSALCALDLNAHAVGIGESSDASRDLLVETWPAAPGIEFAFGPIERRPAALALVRPRRLDVLVLPGEWRFGALPNDNALLFWAQLSPLP